MDEKQKVGEIFTFFAKPMVAALRLTGGSLSVGDKISIEGHTTKFTQIVESMQVAHESVQSIEVGREIGLKVVEKVRPHDIVYKLIEK